MPYISASIAMQLLAIAVPYFARLQKRRRKRPQKNESVYPLPYGSGDCPAGLRVFCLSEKPFRQRRFYYGADGIVLVYLRVVITAAILFTMWMGERITDKGIGNGISLLIMVGIIAGLPAALANEITHRGADGGGGYIPFVLEIAFVFVIMGCILLA